MNRPEGDQAGFTSTTSSWVTHVVLPVARSTTTMSDLGCWNLRKTRRFPSGDQRGLMWATSFELSL
jgi:hypothetical protein